MTTHQRRETSVGGIVLIVIGTVFLLSSLDVIDIGDLVRYLFDLWPLLLIAVGVKLVVDSRRGRPAAPPPPPGTP